MAFTRTQDATGNVHKELRTARSIIALTEREFLKPPSDHTYPIRSQAE